MQTDSAQAAWAAQLNNRWSNPEETAFGRFFVVTIRYVTAYTDDRSVMRYVLPQSDDRIGCSLPWIGAAGRQHSARLSAALAGFAGADRGRPVPISALTGGEHTMKVVVWKSPKYLRGILCRLFHIT